MADERIGAICVCAKGIPGLAMRFGATPNTASGYAFSGFKISDGSPWQSANPTVLVPAEEVRAALAGILPHEGA